LDAHGQQMKIIRSLRKKDAQKVSDWVNTNNPSLEEIDQFVR